MKRPGLAGIGFFRYHYRLLWTGVIVDLSMADEDLGDVLNNLDTINKAKAATLKKDGDTFYRQGFYDAALNSFNEALLLDPDNPDVLNSKGLTLVKLGKIDEAKAVEKKRTEMLEKLPPQPEHESRPFYFGKSSTSRPEHSCPPTIDSGKREKK